MKILESLGSILTFNKKTSFPTIDINKIQTELGSKFFGILNSTFENRLKDTANSQFTQNDVNGLISSYSKKNMLIAAASSAVPGPMAVFTAIPELVLTTSNQMAMVYDLGCCFNKENIINKDLLIDIPIAAFGGKTNLAAIQANPANLIESGADLLKDKAITLGKVMIENTLKKSVIKFIPVGGSVIMGLFAQKSTKKMANIAVDFFDDTRVLVLDKKELPIEITNLLELEKIKACINLIGCDNNLNEDEIRFIQPMIEGSIIPADQKRQLLRDAQKVNTTLTINFNVFKTHSTEAADFVSDLVALSKRDGQVKAVEKIYIMEFCRRTGLDRNEALQMLEV